MWFPLRAAALAVLVLTGMIAAPVAAQTDIALRGSYVRDEAASDPVQKIVDSGMSKLGRLYRVWPISGQARRRLEVTNLPHNWLQIAIQGDQLTIESDRYTLTTPRNGELKRWERVKGDFVDVSTQLQGTRLEQRFVANDGQRVNVYTLSPDGKTLTLDVTVTSPKLDGPLTYRQVYRRR